MATESHVDRMVRSSLQKAPAEKILSQSTFWLARKERILTSNSKLWLRGYGMLYLIYPLSNIPALKRKPEATTSEGGKDNSSFILLSVHLTWLSR